MIEEPMSGASLACQCKVLTIHSIMALFPRFPSKEYSKGYDSRSKGQ